MNEMNEWMCCFHHESRCNYTPAWINSFVYEDRASQGSHLLPWWFLSCSLNKASIKNKNFSPPYFYGKSISKSKTCHFFTIVIITRYLLALISKCLLNAQQKFLFPLEVLKDFNFGKRWWRQRVSLFTEQM